jgi:hypothetical protein
LFVSDQEKIQLLATVLVRIIAAPSATGTAHRRSQGYTFPISRALASPRIQISQWLCRGRERRRAMSYETLVYLRRPATTFNEDEANAGRKIAYNLFAIVALMAAAELVSSGYHPGASQLGNARLAAISTMKVPTSSPSVSAQN